MSHPADLIVADHASGNTGDGVDVTESDDAVVELFVAANNGGDGVHIGCSSGPSSRETFSSCSANSDVRVSNAFFGDGIANEVSDNGVDGVFLDTSEAGARDQVTTVQAKGNGNLDLHDATANCGSAGAFNFWYGNSFLTSSPALNATTACID